MRALGLPGRGVIMGAVIGATWFGAIGGWSIVNPANFEWVAGDRAQHLLGWLFFRNEPLGLPLGRIDSLIHPVGTTLGFTDSNPWISLLLRPLSAWLPVDFQFIGAWLLSCFMLQGVFGFRLMETLTTSALARGLGVAAFVMAPVLADRMGHDTLTAQWLVLALMWLHLRSGVTVRNTLTWAWALNLFAAGVHPYLAVMLAVLTVALLIQLCRGPERFEPRRAVAYGAGIIGQTLAIFVLLGYFGGGEELAEGGFGEFSTDVLAFINPMRESLVLPMLPMRHGQREGFAFLGSGILLLMVIATAVLAVQRRRPVLMPRHRPLVVAAMLMWVFALSDQVTIAGYTVLTMRKLYDPLTPIVESFRSSGRFVWPLYYLLIAGVLGIVMSQRTLRPRVGVAVIVLALAVQAAETRHITYFGNEGWPKPQSPQWDGLDATYRHMVLFPAHYPVGPSGCGSDDVAYEYRDLVRASYIAYVHGLTFNSGYVARAPMDKLETYCQTLNEDVATGRFAYDTLYIVATEAAAPFLEPDSGVTCGTLDEFLVCVSDSFRGRFHRLLRAESQAVN